MTKKKIKADTIITSHINADFDAVASMLAAQKLYPDSVIIFPGTQEKNLKDFFISTMSYLFNMAKPSTIDFSSVKRLVIVDTKQKNRLLGVEKLLEKKNIDIHIYDHHPPFNDDIRGSFELIHDYGATVTILSKIIREKKIKLTSDEATIMALGIYEDTGLFTYASTKPEDFKEAAFLLSCGASLDTIANLVVKEIRSDQVTWLNELLNEMVLHKINGIDVHISTISSPKYIADLASIVQKIVRMENLDVFFTIVLMDNKVNIIARNRLPDIDVGKIMANFGGGGHLYAASAKLHNKTLAQVEQQLLKLLTKNFKSHSLATTLMSSPVITIDPDMKCKDASTLMTQYNKNVLLVIKENSKFPEGYITRQIIEKIIYHNLEHLSVKEYMNSEVVTISANATLSKIEQIIIENGQPILPVKSNNKIKGVITKTDLLNFLVQHNKDIKQSEKEDINTIKEAKKRKINNIISQRLDKYHQDILISLGNIGNKLGYGTYVVGGFVRDLLINRKIDDIDIVVEGDGIAFAKKFAEINGLRTHGYKKFGTAVIIYPDGFKIDVASARYEYYKTPAALPTIKMSSIKSDLFRRDFTINTFAICLNPNNYGTIIDFFGANRDLKDKAIRVIHNLSFVEDPTRIFRAIKFANRFDFTIGKVTSSLIKNAIDIDCFKNLSGLRVLSELKQIFEEENPIPAIKSLQHYGLEKILHPELNIDNDTYKLFDEVYKVLSWHDLLYTDEKFLRWSLYFMALTKKCSFKIAGQLCTRLKLPEKEKIIILKNRLKAQKHLSILENNFPLKNSELYKLLSVFKTELILYMIASANTQNTKKAITHYYTKLKSVKISIRGKDLLAMGLKPGPFYSDTLTAILNAKLDKEIKTKTDEKKYAVKYIKGNKLIDS
ncbi:MAG: CBS domain-containing protein [Desulfobacterales bacterium]|nr:CBS domain-containing protein [Desulfobacterales bacterium]